jgi:hypothetical protein
MKRAQCAAILMVVIAGSANAVADQVAFESPLHNPQAAEGGWLTLEWNQEAYEALRSSDRFSMQQFPLADGLRVDLELQRFDVLAADARIVVVDENGERDLPRPDVLLFRGRIVGEPDSKVFLSFSPHGSNGHIHLPEQTYIIATPPPHQALPTVVYETSSLPDGAINLFPARCGNDELPMGGAVSGFKPLAASPAGAGYNVGDSETCRVVTVAVDTDFQYTDQVFGGNTAASAAYIPTLIGAVSELFRTGINVGIELTYVRVWSTTAEPYAGATVSDRLWELRTHWQNEMGEVQRNIAHILTGLRVGPGGQAFLGVICDPPWAYGASGYIIGSFPYPLTNNNWQNWDPSVVAHEIGHNFNGPHTHEIQPRIDGCGIGICTGANQGTIMSYCHQCPGGISNIRLEFHQRIINEYLLPYVNNAPCSILRTPISITGHPATQSVIAGTGVQLSVQVSGSGPITYRWRRNGVIVTNGGAVSGATTNTLTISNVQAHHAGAYTVEVVNACSAEFSNIANINVVQPCYANCDGSANPPILNILDFICFINHFSYASTLSPSQQIGNYANCDRSTTEPVLTVNDFICFLDKFTLGCD